MFDGTSLHLEVLHKFDSVYKLSYLLNQGVKQGIWEKHVCKYKLYVQLHNVVLDRYTRIADHKNMVRTMSWISDSYYFLHNGNDRA